ncbi:uncharacterized protein LOC135467204 [Liolophura sinensis]|uniref:uncharacterized protein LOC135467204 n=1 Tax=Liolophura sinensis TaxID=3198878 RepID=UPI0031593CFD
MGNEIRSGPGAPSSLDACRNDPIIQSTLQNWPIQAEETLQGQGDVGFFPRGSTFTGKLTPINAPRSGANSPTHEFSYSLNIDGDRPLRPRVISIMIESNGRFIQLRRLTTELTQSGTIPVNAAQVASIRAGKILFRFNINLGIIISDFDVELKPVGRMYTSTPGNYNLEGWLQGPEYSSGDMTTRTAVTPSGFCAAPMIAIEVALEGNDGALNGLLAYSQLEDKLFVQGVLPSRSPSTVWNLFFRSFISTDNLRFPVTQINNDVVDGIIDLSNADGITGPFLVRANANTNGVASNIEQKTTEIKTALPYLKSTSTIKIETSVYPTALKLLQV